MTTTKRFRASARPPPQFRTSLLERHSRRITTQNRAPGRFNGPKFWRLPLEFLFRYTPTGLLPFLQINSHIHYVLFILGGLLNSELGSPVTLIARNMIGCQADCSYSVPGTMRTLVLDWCHLIGQRDSVRYRTRH